MARKQNVPVLWRRLGWVSLALLFLAAGAVIGCNAWVSLSVASFVYSDAGEIPPKQVGVVLGTSKNVAPNRPNLHFQTRMEAAAELYQAGKIQHVLVSGAENSRYYNEPRDMERELMRLGVPEGAITRDPSGFRTLDSVVRAARVFGQESYIVISDDFHVARAVFLARHFEHEVTGFSAKSVAMRYSLKSRLREVLARVKAVLDAYLLQTPPRELEAPRPIEVV